MAVTPHFPRRDSPGMASPLDAVRRGQTRGQRMALDKDRNRVLAALRDHPEGADSDTLVHALGLTRDAVERHLLYCADYELARWARKKDGSDRAIITDRGRDYLMRQNL